MTAFPASPPRRLRFGEFELDARSGELRNNGRRVTLADQPLQVLLALVERSGELVTRDELRQRLWPEQTFVDFDHGLNAAVKRLRDALSDSADSPRYIETLPRRGYRFVAPVENEGLQEAAAHAASAHPGTVPATPVVGGSISGRVRTVVLAAGLVALVAAAGWWVAQDGRDETTSSEGSGPVHRDLTRLTFDAGLQTDVSWSPDGQHIAYASDQGGNFDIWVQSAAGGTPVPLTIAPEDDTEPAWSPDGSRIAFRSERDGGGLFVMPARGGAARKLTSIGNAPVWSEDGRSLTFLHGMGFQRGSPYPDAVYEIEADGGGSPRELLSHFLARGSWIWIAPNPDGTFLVYGSHREMGRGIFSVASDGADFRHLIPPPELFSSLGLDVVHPRLRFHWNRSGSTVFFDVISKEVASVWKVPTVGVDLDWRRAERLTTGTGAVVSSAISPDGTRLAFSDDQTTLRAWVFPFDARRPHLTGDGRPVTPQDVNVTGVDFSPDGRSVLFPANRRGSESVDIMQVDWERRSSRLVARNTWWAAVSNDGDRFSYPLFRWSPTDLERSQPAQGLHREFALAVREREGTERLISPWSGSSVFQPMAWSSDGQALLGTYWTSREPGEDPYAGPAVLALWLLNRSAGDGAPRILRHVPGRGFYQVRFSPRDRWISFVSTRADAPDRLELGIIPAANPSSEQWTRIASDHQWPDKPRWAPDGQTLFFLSRKDAAYLNVWGVRMDFERGVPAGEPFQITQFDSSEFMVNPNIIATEIGVAANHLALPMRSGGANIWLLSDVDK